MDMEDWKVEKVENVPVTLHLTPEAAHILYQYAGERGRGKFVSELLINQRLRDEREAARVRGKVVADLKQAARPKKKRR